MHLRIWIKEFWNLSNVNNEVEARLYHLYALRISLLTRVLCLSIRSLVSILFVYTSRLLKASQKRVSFFFFFFRVCVYNNQMNWRNTLFQIFVYSRDQARLVAAFYFPALLLFPRGAERIILPSDTCFPSRTAFKAKDHPLTDTDTTAPGLSSHYIMHVQKIKSFNKSLIISLLSRLACVH